MDDMINQLSYRVDKLERDVSELMTKTETKAKTKTKTFADGKDLLTSEQQEIIDFAIDAGLIRKCDDGSYLWCKSNALLSYFCGRLFCGDKPMTGFDGKAVWDLGNKKFPVTKIQQLFLEKPRDDYRRKRSMLPLPKDYEIVDALWQ